MNSLTRMPPQQIADPASGWWWNGSQWVCGCDDFPPCSPAGPPPFFPPPQGQPPWYPGANAGVSFSTTAPPNPIRGAFWWNGTTLFMFDGAAWVGVGGASGGGTPPSTTPPSNPQPGQQWFNGSTLFVWDGNAWVPVAGTQTFIQATAPAAPSPGDLWYDGTQLRIWDGSAWELVGPGATVGPVPTTTDVFSLSQSSPAITGMTATWSIPAITAAPTIDAQTAWDPVTHKITPKKAGVYAYFINAYYGGSGTTLGGIALLKNDQGSWQQTSQIVVAQSFESGVPNTLGAYLTGSGFVKMNGTTDYVRLWGIYDTGTLYVNSGLPLIHGFLLP